MKLSRITFTGIIAIASVTLAPLHANGQVERENYIVGFKQSFDSKLEEAAVISAGGRVLKRYESVFSGIAVSLPVVAIDAIRSRPGVEFVELDGLVSTMATQGGATWGLDRIDQKGLPLNSTYTYNFTGVLASMAPIDVYVIDTGIRSDHAEFTGRVAKGFSSVNDRRGTEDCNGHGTHVSGTIGGTTYGVAKQVRLIPVRVLDCRGSGTWSGVIAGLDWVASAHQPGVAAVANMSLGGGGSASLDRAVEAVVADGVTVVVAAGNSNVDACTTSPARVPAVLTVGASTSGDGRASFSNFGSCLDIFAPGVSITSAWNTSRTATNILSGTSMASPHVAGVAALLLSEGVGDVAGTLLSRATTGAVGGAGIGSPNRLVYSLAN